MIEELNQTIRFNEMLTGILAHDLRNPLNVITVSGHILARHEDSTRIAKPVSRILNSADRMGRMITQLLDFAHVRLGGGLKLSREEVDLGGLCTAVADELGTVHGDRSVRVELAGDLVGSWDKDRLVQLLGNLCANACQHGTPGAPVTVRADGSTREAVVVEVSNEGVIPAERLPGIFEPLRIGKRNERSSGLGLGLYITQQIAEAHGGKIEASSGSERGTRFTVTLPRHPPENAKVFRGRL
jgi:signal transduction histidine kinase